MADENLHKELDLIQGVISRMAGNSFLIKGWAMTLVSALVAFGKDTVLDSPNGLYYLMVMIGVIVPFWWLDAFYLRRERIFQKIYQQAVTDPDGKKTQRVLYSLDPTPFKTEVASQAKIMREKFMLWFYLPFILIILAAIVMKLSGAIAAEAPASTITITG
jgi:hypothetical protein